MTTEMPEEADEDIDSEDGDEGDELICDRCGRVPGVASDGRTAYCHMCCRRPDHSAGGRSHHERGRKRPRSFPYPRLLKVAVPWIAPSLSTQTL